MINFSPVRDDLVVGTCPASALDLRRMHQGGIGAVVNLQSDQDFSRLGINWQALESLYYELGIAVYRVPMIDFDEVDIARLLPRAADAVASAMHAGHRTYLHCTAGRERSPTTAVAWLAWHGGCSLDDALAMMRNARPVNPYEDILRRLTAERTAS